MRSRLLVYIVKTICVEEKHSLIDKTRSKNVRPEIEVEPEGIRIMTMRIPKRIGLFGVVV